VSLATIFDTTPKRIYHSAQTIIGDILIMGKMKNLHLLENCFAQSHDIQDAAKLEAISSKLIPANTNLQKENEGFALQVKRQDLCIGHLLKRLETATNLARGQQTSFDEAIHRQTETLAAMFQELSKSKTEIIQLRNELVFERTKNKSIEYELNTSCKNTQEMEMNDIPTKNIILPDKNVSALEDEIDHLRYSMIQQEAQYKDSLREKRFDVLPKRNEGNSLHQERISPEADTDPRNSPPPLDMKDKKSGRSGLQEEDIDVPRPPLFRPASGLRGWTQSLIETSAFQGLAKSKSRAFGIDAVRLSGSARGLPSS
jgi:hypothetical protein